MGFSSTMGGEPRSQEASTGKSYYGDASLYFLRADGEEADRLGPFGG